MMTYLRSGSGYAWAVIPPMIILLIFCWVILVALSPAYATDKASETHLDRPSNLSNLIQAVEETESLRVSIREHCEAAQQSLRWKEGLGSIQQALEHPLDQLSDTHLNQATLVQLFDLERQANDQQSILNHGAEGLEQSLSQLEDDYDRLRQENQLWQNWQTLAEERQAPLEVVKRIADLQVNLEDSQTTLMIVRDELMRDLDQVAGLRLRIAALKNEITRRRAEIDRQVRMAAGDYIWQSKLTGQDWTRTVAMVGPHFQAQFSRLAPYWRDHWVFLITTFLGLWAFCFSLLRINRRDQSSDVDGKNNQAIPVTQAVLARPYSASFSFALLGVAIVAPSAPTAFYDVINFILPLVALYLGYGLRGHWVPLSLVGFAAVFLPVLFWGVLELLPELDRWVLLFQAIVLMGCLAWDLRHGHWYQAVPEVPGRGVQMWLSATILSLFVGFLANMLGHVGIARVTIWSSIVTLSDTLVFGSVACVIYTLIAVSLESSFARHSRVLAAIHGSLLRWTGFSLVAGVTLYVVLNLLRNYGLFEPFMDGLKGLLQWKAPLGQQSISLGQGLMAFGVLLATWGLIKLLALLLEEEIFPRLALPLGLPFAISSLSRYLVGLLGVILAMQTLGFDLTKVTLLAGALGVGIGFGLQNIFNNFASGLILLVERPMNVGDVIENGKLIGIVRRIGIRSSTIRTLQGAEVILPNAELIAKPVINWTLSDRLRRMEIDLAVEAQNTEVEVVASILEAAARDSEDVLKEPPPYALVTGFGDGNLNFRLCAWINHYEDESQIASSVRRSILRRFEAAGVKIPDP